MQSLPRGRYGLLAFVQVQSKPIWKNEAGCAYVQKRLISFLCTHLCVSLHMASQAVGWGACINHREMEKEDLKLENSPAFRHSIPVQMRFNDADVLGHINNSVYFSYYDLGKTAYFTAIRKTGIDWSRPDLVAANINCNFYSPMYFGEPVSVVTRVEWIHEKSFKLHQRLINVVTKEIKSECETIMVAYDSGNRTATAIPMKLVKLICEYEGRNLLESKKEKTER